MLVRGAQDSKSREQRWLGIHADGIRVHDKLARDRVRLAIPWERVETVTARDSRKVLRSLPFHSLFTLLWLPIAAPLYSHHVRLRYARRHAGTPVLSFLICISRLVAFAE